MAAIQTEDEKQVFLKLCRHSKASTSHFEPTEAESLIFFNSEPRRSHPLLPASGHLLSASGRPCAANNCRNAYVQTSMGSAANRCWRGPRVRRTTYRGLLTPSLQEPWLMFIIGTCLHARA